jgi:twinkle protein
MTDTISATALAWLEMRGIDPELAVRLGWRSVEEDDREWLRQPFVVDGAVVNHRLRRVDGVGWEMEETSPQPLWNVDCMADATLADQPWIWAEDVEDAAVAVHCGFPRTVALPVGPISGPAEGVRDAQAKFAFLKYHAKTIGDFRRANRERTEQRKEPVPIILAMPQDSSGAMMLHELANRLGTALCKWVRYPKANPQQPPFPNGRTHCRNLTEVYQHWGQVGVRRTIESARWMKIKGVARMSEIPPRPERHVWSTGLEWLDTNVKMRFGDLWVVTGIPGQGKTTFVNAIVNAAVRRYKWGCVWAGFEQDPQSDHKTALREWYLEKEEWRCSPQELMRADEWIEDHYVFICPQELEDDDGEWDDDIPLPNAKDGVDNRADVRWVVKSISQAVYRYGVKIAVIDPWNEIDHAKPPDMSETAYVGWALKVFRKAAMKLNILLIVIAHPTKMQAGEIPGLYSISDSANWANKPDIGLVVFQDEASGKSMLRVCKVRQRGVIGEKGDVWTEYHRESRHFLPAGNPMAALQEDEEYVPKKRRKGNGAGNGHARPYSDD